MRDEIRATGLGLLIAGVVCLYFGTQLVTVVPADLTPEQRAAWIAFERGLYVALRVVGIGFLGAALLAWSGWRGSQVLAVGVESLCGVLMLVLGSSWLYKHWLIGGFNWFALAVLALAVLSFASARHAWRLYRFDERAAESQE